MRLDAVQQRQFSAQYQQRSVQRSIPWRSCTVFWRDYRALLAPTTHILTMTRRQPGESDGICSGTDAVQSHNVNAEATKRDEQSSPEAFHCRQTEAWIRGQAHQQGHSVPRCHQLIGIHDRSHTVWLHRCQSKMPLVQLPELREGVENPAAAPPHPLFFQRTTLGVYEGQPAKPHARLHGRLQRQMHSSCRDILLVTSYCISRQAYRRSRHKHDNTSNFHNLFGEVADNEASIHGRFKSCRAIRQQVPFTVEPNQHRRQAGSCMQYICG
jgi:hypothetical protein